MNKELKNSRYLNDTQLDQVSGGTSVNDSSQTCPICHSPVAFSRNTRYMGANITLYMCSSCKREFSLTQIQGEESLAVDYTGQGDDDFARDRF